MREKTSDRLQLDIVIPAAVTVNQTWRVQVLMNVYS